MSHLAHIVKLKEFLINEGIVNPQTQIDIVQGCYVKALISINASNKLDEPTCVNFNRWILSYWNEVTPVKGNLVASQVATFFRNLDAALRKPILDSELEVRVIEKIGGVDEDKYVETDAYCSLIQVLIDEGNKKLSQFTETNHIA